jgi:hypothetical protein
MKPFVMYIRDFIDRIRPAVHKRIAEYNEGRVDIEAVDEILNNINSYSDLSRSGLPWWYSFTRSSDRCSAWNASKEFVKRSVINTAADTLTWELAGEFPYDEEWFKALDLVYVKQAHNLDDDELDILKI